MAIVLLVRPCGVGQNWAVGFYPHYLLTLADVAELDNHLVFRQKRRGFPLFHEIRNYCYRIVHVQSYAVEDKFSCSTRCRAWYRLPNSVLPPAAPCWCLVLNDGKLKYLLSDVIANYVSKAKDRQG
jgi:hypothetical protein